MRKRRWLTAAALLLFATPQLFGADLPKNLKWESNDNPPLIASPDAKPGGTFTTSVNTFPLTFRVVGPDSNTVLYTALLSNNMSLTSVHPNTKAIIPMLATHWAFGKDGRTMYYKIDPKAKWSDGKPVTAEDFAFTIEFMRSKNIMAPWYNNFYTEEMEKVTVYDPHTISVTVPRVKPDLHLWADISPTPKHFYGGKVPTDFVQKYNWKVVPNTGPYQIDEKQVKKGKSVAFVKKKDWWAKDRPFFKNRFNVDKVLFKVVREQTINFEQFKKAQLDMFPMNDPAFWHEKSDIPIFKKGYVEKLWFHNDRPRGCFGIWLNTQQDVFKDENVRKGIAHAMNFDKVISTVERGETERLQSCTQGYGEYSNTSVKALAFDLAKSNAFFEKAGFITRDAQGYRINSKKQRLEFELLYAYDGHTPRLVVLAEDAKKAGIKMNLGLKDWSALIKQMNANKHQANYSGFGARDSGIPDYWGIWHGDNANKENTNNIGNVNDPELNKLIDTFRTSVKKEDRVAMAQKISARIGDLSVLIPATVSGYFRVAYWRWWRLPTPAATNLSESAFELFSPETGGLFWLDENIKKETQAAMKAGKALKPVTNVDKTYKNWSTGKGKK